MSKYTKLQQMLAEGMGCEPGDPKVAAAIEKTAEWFEIVLETMGLQPSAIPALVRWQHWHSVMSEECEEDYDSFDTIEELFEDLHAEDVQAPNGDFLKNYPEVTRVEVIAGSEREFVCYDCSKVQVSLQDDGRTLKVFLKQG